MLLKTLEINVRWNIILRSHDDISTSMEDAPTTSSGGHNLPLQTAPHPDYMSMGMSKVVLCEKRDFI